MIQYEGHDILRLLVDYLHHHGVEDGLHVVLYVLHVLQGLGLTFLPAIGGALQERVIQRITVVAAAHLLIIMGQKIELLGFEPRTFCV